MTDGATDFRTTLEDYLTGLKGVLDALPRDDLDGIAGSLARAYTEGRQVFVIGNGGSATTASHMACDLQKTILGAPPRSDVKRFKIASLTDNIAVLTAWGNDVSYDAVFAEQLSNLANAGDLLVVITASGNSPNIVEAVKTAKALGLQTIGLLGFEGGTVKNLLDQSVVVRSTNYGFIEDVHMVLNHLITAHFQQLVSHSAGGAE